jgi:hypothetical protein
MIALQPPEPPAAVAEPPPTCAKPFRDLPPWLPGTTFNFPEPDEEDSNGEAAA